MTIIELPNGIKVHADVVEIASDGSINAYNEEVEVEETEEIEAAKEIGKIGTKLHEQLEEFNRLHGGDDTQSVEKELANSITRNNLTPKAREMYDFLLERGGRFTVKNIAEEMGITDSSAWNRFTHLSQYGLVKRTKIKGEWKLA